MSEHAWLQTYTGRAFYPLNPRVEDVDPVDIAHALSNLCRYGGHCRRFYSVAEHSVLISGAVSPENALAGLLHDAAEAYLVDLPRPIKRAVGLEAYRDAEARLELVIAERFGLDPVTPAEVHAADSRILLDEKAALMGPAPQSWALDGLEPLGVRVSALAPHMAEIWFLERLRELGVT